MREIWKPIEGYDGIYEVSNKGRVRSYYNNKHGMRKKPRIIKGLSGLYETVALRKNGKNNTQNVHRLVAQAFIPNPNNLKEVNHIDGNKKNNIVTNLEWVSHKSNMVHASIHHLYGQCKKVKCIEDNEIFGSITDVGRRLGLKQPTISKLIHKNKKIKGKTYIIMEG